MARSLPLALRNASMQQREPSRCEALGPAKVSNLEVDPAAFQKLGGEVALAQRCHCSWRWTHLIRQPPQHLRKCRLLQRARHARRGPTGGPQHTKHEQVPLVSTA